MNTTTLVSNMSIFLDKTADTPAFRIIEYFLEARETDHAIADIIDVTGLARSTFYTAWPLLLKHEYIIVKRTVGKTTLYVLNAANPYVRAYLTIAEQALRDASPKRRVVVNH